MMPVMYVYYKFKITSSNTKRSFRKNFRINKEAFKYILSELEDKIKQQSRLGCLRPVDKLAAALRFFAEVNYQHGVGKDWHLNISQSTFSNLLSEVLVAIEEKLCHKWISIKMNEQTKEARMYFFRKSSIPGITMAIDDHGSELLR